MEEFIQKMYRIYVLYSCTEYLGKHLRNALKVIANSHLETAIVKYCEKLCEILPHNENLMVRYE